VEFLVFEEGSPLSRWFLPLVCAPVFSLDVRFGFLLHRGSIRLSRERVWREEETGRVFCCAWASPFRTVCLVLVVKALMNSQYEFALQFARSACADRRRHPLKTPILQYGRIGMWYGQLLIGSGSLSARYFPDCPTFPTGARYIVNSSSPSTPINESIKFCSKAKTAHVPAPIVSQAKYRF
jgi:hypothetical protein